jgi:hypothetical protein
MDQALMTPSSMAGWEPPREKLASWEHFIEVNACFAMFDTGG